MHFTGCYAEGFLLLGKRKQLITDARYSFAVKQKLVGGDIGVSLGGVEVLSQFLKKGETVFVHAETLSVAIYNKLCQNFCVEDGTSYINRLISQKTQTQLEFISQSCNVCERAFLQTLPFVQLGVTELDVSAEIEYRFKKLGAEGTSFQPIIAFGKNSAVPHHQTGVTRLENNSVVLMDFGCKKQGYCSDMTRTMFFGSPSPKFLQAYDAVKTAHQLAKQTICAKMTAIEADAVARNHLKSMGFGANFTHSLGHGIGTLIHEYPSLSPRGDAVLENGNVFSIEPGVYFDGEFGIRIEDTVCLQNDKVQSFMTDGLDLKIL